MQKLRDNSQRARNAILLIWIILCLDILLIISGYMQYSLLSNFKTTGDISLDAAKRNDVREQLFNILYLIFFIFSAITFIQWFRRAYYNLHTKVRPLAQTEGWASGAWFVPIISLYMPY